MYHKIYIIIFHKENKEITDFIKFDIKKDYSC